MTTASATTPLPLLPEAVAQPIKKAIAARVAALFNDTSRSEKPVGRHPDSLFGPRSVAWRVHGDITSMMVGGVASLLLQMLHPAVLAGVWDHSNFRADMHGRLRRTARFIARTTYGERGEAMAMIARIRGIHDRVQGVLPDGTPYAANDPALLAWVHVTETTSFLDAWIRYSEPDMSVADQDRYFDEMAQIAEVLGAHPVPRSRSEAQALIEAMRPQLRCDSRTRAVSRLILTRPAQTTMTGRLMALTMDAAIDLLPDWAVRMHRLYAPATSRPLVRAGTLGIARTLRWAFS
jgi:uncharacterized protein (DUF2236 family)